MTATPKPTNSRLYYLDNLRVLLTLLVILVHLAITYGAPGDWYYHDAPLTQELPKLLMTLFVALCQSFFMGFFFMISSFFAEHSLARKGFRFFLRDRAIRLGIPLLIYLFVFGALVEYSINRLSQGAQIALWPFCLDYLRQLHGGNVGPMWFVEFLLLLNLLHSLWFAYGSSRIVPKKMPSNRAILLVALSIGIVTFAVRLWKPRGTEFAPMHLQIPYAVQYVTYYAIGIMAARGDWFDKFPAKSFGYWSKTFLAMIAAFPVAVIAGSGPEGDLSVFDGGINWQSMVAALWEQVIGIAIILLLTIGTRTRFNTPSGVMRMASDGAYSAYMIHPLVTVPTAILLAGISLESHWKFLLFAPALAGMAFLAGFGIKRTPIIGRIV